MIINDASCLGKVCDFFAVMKPCYRYRYSERNTQCAELKFNDYLNEKVQVHFKLI